jgi:hypothetical protein
MRRPREPAKPRDCAGPLVGHVLGGSEIVKCDVPVDGTRRHLLDSLLEGYPGLGIDSIHDRISQNVMLGNCAITMSYESGRTTSRIFRDGEFSPLVDVDHVARAGNQAREREVAARPERTLRESPEMRDIEAMLAGFTVAVEFRNKTWFDTERHTARTLEFELAKGFRKRRC